MKIDRLTPDIAILKELGKRLARFRKQQGMSQEVLARESGLGVATLRRIESGEGSQLESWLKIMKTLDMTASIEALLPEKFDSPMAEVLSDTGRKKRPAGGKNPVVSKRWGDEGK